MSKTVRLKDGSEAVIRPLQKDDLELSYSFFKSLPEKDRAYLRRDVTKREIIEERIREIDTGKVRRLVALVNGDIAAEGSLELSPQEWNRHVGEIRLIVAQPWKRKGLGVRMARELYVLAAAEKLEEIVVRMMRPQLAAQSIFKRLGFKEEIVLPGYVKDVLGRKQDLLLMRCDLESLWREMEFYFQDMDYRTTKYPRP
jgi:L-amino acid N-acyltransferase YncA